MKNKGILGNRDQTWRTPREFYKNLDNEFHFDFDPCPDNPPKFDGLAIEWGKCNFVNPPYSGNNIYRWLQKGIEESKNGKMSVFLLPSRTGTAWFHDIVLGIPLKVRWIRGRLRFGADRWSAPFDSMLVIIGDLTADKPKVRRFKWDDPEWVK